MNLCYLNKTKPILSIALMTSNRKDTIRKCLDSLTHLRKNVDCELIITDTGCDEEMRSIIEEYTDIITKFKWVNDFSIARNESLKIARGEWYMYLDDDEWFEDTLEIEEFFKTGRYKNVEGCWYIQRNYNDMTGRTYNDDTVSRMVKKVPGIHFEGCIHELLQPFDGKYTVVKSYVHHYGYVFKSEADKYKHSMRNLPLLHNMMKEHPNDMRWWLQTAQEYRAIKEYSKIHELCEQGLEHFKNTDDKYTNRQLGSFYMAMIDSCYYTFKFDKAIEDCKRALEDKRISQMARAAVNEALTRSYAKSGNLSEAKKAADNYFKIYDELKNDPERMIEEGYYIIDETFNERHMSAMYWIMIKEALSRGDVPQIKTYFEKINWDNSGLFLFDKETPIDLFDFVARHEFDLWFVQLVTRFFARADLRGKFTDQLKGYEKEAPDKFKNMLRICSYIGIDHYYLNYMKVLAVGIDGAYNLTNEELEKYVGRSFVEDDEFLLYKMDYWEKISEKDINPVKLFVPLNYEYFEGCINQLCMEDIPNKHIEYIMEVVDRNLKENSDMEFSQAFKKDIRYKYFVIRTTEEKLRRLKDTSSDLDEVRSYIEDFVNTQLDFYGEYYKEETLISQSEILPGSCRAALSLNMAFAYEEDSDYKAALSEYKRVIAMYAPISETIQNYAHLYADSVSKKLKAEEEAVNNNTAPASESKNTEDMNASNEMEQINALAVQIKANARNMIAAGQFDDARNILNQLKMMIPDDPEIEEMMRKL